MVLRTKKALAVHEMNGTRAYIYFTLILLYGGLAITDPNVTITQHCNYGSCISATPPTERIVALWTIAVNIVVMVIDA